MDFLFRVFESIKPVGPGETSGFLGYLLSVLEFF